MKTNTESFRGLVAMVCDVPDGMSVIKNLETAKAVVRDIAPRAKHEWLLTRIAQSRFPGPLLAFLPEIYGTDHRQMLPLVEAMRRAQLNAFERDDIDTVANSYWSLVVRERIVRGDYRRAWDEIRRSLRGFRPQPFTADEMLGGHVWRYPQDMAASVPTITTLLNELFTAMREKGLIEEPARATLEYRMRIDGQWSEPGALFVIATANYNDVVARHGSMRPKWITLTEPPITVEGQRMLTIASYFADKRNKQRRERTAQKLKD